MAKLKFMNVKLKTNKQKRQTTNKPKKKKTTFYSSHCLSVRKCRFSISDFNLSSVMPKTAFRDLNIGIVACPFEAKGSHPLQLKHMLPRVFHAQGP